MIRTLLSKTIRLVFAIALGIGSSFCILATAVAQQPLSPSPKMSYDATIRDALEQLIGSVDAIQPDNLDRTRRALRHMQHEAAQLLNSTTSAREKADHDYDLVNQGMKDLEVCAAELSNREETLKGKIKETEDNLAVLQGSIQDTAKTNSGLLDRKQAVVQELSRHCTAISKDYQDHWRYVPIGDLISSNAVARCFSDLDTKNQEMMAVYTSYKAELHKLLEDREKTRGELASLKPERDAMKRERQKTESCLGRQKEAVVYYADLGDFWQKIDAMLRGDLQSAVSAAGETANLPGNDANSTARKNALIQAASDLRESLEGCRKTYLTGGKLRSFGSCTVAKCPSSSVPSKQ